MVSLAGLGGLFSKTRILLAASLLMTWTIASLFTSYRATIHATVKDKFQDALELLPSVRVDWPEDSNPKDQFNSSKVALLVEGRPIPHLVPQVLHMVSIVPPDWRFVFIGSAKSVLHVHRSFATQYQQANGKLDLIVAPPQWNIDSKEGVNRMLTDLNFYDELLPGVEWLLKYESDSMMCGRSDASLNDWLDFDWAGARSFEPSERYANNGGLSFRRISAIRRVLTFQSRYNDTDPEDVWFTRRLQSMPGTRIANAGDEAAFSVEEMWHPSPMGYHVREGGDELPAQIWGNEERRRHIFEYCPELTMIMKMKLRRQGCDKIPMSYGGFAEPDEENHD